MLVYSTYLGRGNADLIYAIAVEPNCPRNCSVYVAGSAGGSEFPTTPGAFQERHAGGFYDAFVAKLNADASALVYSTFLGGSGQEGTYGMAVDAAGNAYVTGLTNSPNFPVTLGAFQRAIRGEEDGFVTKVHFSGSVLVYSTYLGGQRSDNGAGIAVDADGYAYVTGPTSSLDFPTTEGVLQRVLRGGQDAYVTKVNPLGTTLTYSTYLGGSREEGGNAIVVDRFGNAYVTGMTGSPDFPITEDTLQGSYGGNRDAFVTKLNALGTAPVYSTWSAPQKLVQVV